jgi:SOS-response transcriptional repressor LexA
MQRKRGRPSGTPGKRELQRERREKKKNLLLRMIARSVDKYGFQPSYREIASALGYESVGYVHHLIGEMQAERRVVSKGARALQFKWREFV